MASPVTRQPLISRPLASRPPGHRSRTVLSVVFFAVLFLALPFMAPAGATVDIRAVTSGKGITAWLVEDYTVPVVTIRFAFDGGSTQDPQGKEGLANLMAGLFDEGAGDLDSETFQKELDAVGAEMSFNVDRDAIYGSMRMLEERKDEAFDLLRLAVEKPRFDPAPVDRIRGQLESKLLSDSRDPDYQAQRAFNEAIYGEHPYSRPRDGTLETLGAITPSDLEAFHGRLFARANLHVAVVGAIDAETLKRTLDEVFGDLPATPGLTPVAPADLRLGQTVAVDFDLPQSTLRLAYPGVPRKDPAFFAAYLMNHILGGGTFSSRLFSQVREKRGLAYGIGSSLLTYKHADALMIGTATRADRADEALSVIRDVVRGLAEKGPTETELAEAKRNVIGSYAIGNLDSSSAIARTLVALQLDDLGIDYMDRRAGLIESVTLEQVAEAARRLLSAEPAIMVLGPQGKDGG